MPTPQEDFITLYLAGKVKVSPEVEAAVTKQLATTEKFAIRRDPSNSTNWGIIWENSGTEGGYTSEAAARKSALAQNGTEAKASESQTWDW